MRTAAVSKLKASLSEYLEHVKHGEEVLVTERGRPVARIVPLSPSAALPSHLVALERDGRFRRGTGKLLPSFWNASRPRVPQGKLLEALRRDREEGW